MPWSNGVFIADEKETEKSLKTCVEHKKKVAEAKKYVCPFCHKKVCYVIDGKFECPECEIFGLDPAKVFKRHK